MMLRAFLMRSIIGAALGSRLVSPPPPSRRLGASDKQLLPRTSRAPFERLFRFASHLAFLYLASFRVMDRLLLMR